MLTIYKRIACKILGHKWDWYIPNREHTIIGTQWCVRCNSVLRGVVVKHDD
jgi:hypothetical protein